MAAQVESERLAPQGAATSWCRLPTNELWRELDALLAKHVVKYTRVAGHSGHPENDRVDELAVAAYQRYL